MAELINVDVTPAADARDAVRKRGHHVTSRRCSSRGKGGGRRAFRQVVTIWHARCEWPRGLYGQGQLPEVGVIC